MKLGERYLESNGKGLTRSIPVRLHDHGFISQHAFCAFPSNGKQMEKDHQTIWKDMSPHSEGILMFPLWLWEEGVL